jgi:hypothetical protein
MLETLRGRYASEFANIPEKFRPKPKAYVARAAYYKEPGKERDNYINSWIQTDRDVAEARMGINVMNKYEKQQNQYAPPSAIVSRTHLGTANLEATAKPLRIQAEKSEKKLLHVAERAEESILKRAKDPATRVAARSITSEVKRQAKALTSEANRQANALEKAAKEQIKIESQKAFAELEAKAKENLTVARAGVKPNKILTRRLARMRNQGHGITAESFLKEEKAKGRYESPKKRGRKTYKKKNNSNSNSGIPLNSFAESR